MNRCHRLFLFLLVGGLLASCAKNKETDLKPCLNAANDIILIHRPFIFAFNMLIKASLDSALQSGYHATIDSAAVVLNPGKKKYTFSFTGKLCPDSVIRFGNFQAILDTGLYVQGSVTKIIFSYYSEDGHAVSASDSFVYEGSVPGSGLTFRNYINGAVITKDTARKIRWDGSFVFVAPADMLVQGTRNAVVSVDGSGQGTSSMGYFFQSAITSALRDSLSCPWPREGIITFQIPDAEPGGGSILFMAQTSCNNIIWYDFNGVIYHWWIRDKYLIQ
jgi:hypothetical protein